MLTEEFLLAITQADFIEIVGSNRLYEFYQYINTVEAGDQEELIIRFLLERDNPDGIPSPFYMWVVFPLDEGGEAQIHLPDFDEPLTQLENEELNGKLFFAIDDPPKRSNRGRSGYQ